MANWVNNIVHFYGHKKSLSALVRYVGKARELEAETQHGQLLEVNNIKTEGWMHSLSVEDNTESEVCIRYETKNEDNINIIKEIAEVLNLNFLYSFEEGGNKIYGQYRLIQAPGFVEKRELTDDEYDQGKVWYKYKNGLIIAEIYWDEYQTLIKEKGGEDEAENYLDENDYEMSEDWEKLDDLLEGTDWEEY